MANLFPNINLPEEQIEEVSQNVSFGRSWRFDYNAGEFVMTPTGIVAVSAGTDAWLEWCKKALQTERYVYLIYSQNYGQEFNDLIRSNLPSSAIEAEIQRITTETLMIDPRTARVDGFSYQWEEECCYYTCVISNIYEEVATIQGSVVNS
ncbi:DUF2634 domain-containing protein [Cohnella abietis]|uniref:Phage-like element PBSX protein XkdS n=1 Tax=Cohnella abietis TaxID=2507935 RepID=A0A3T1D0B3_9BACL|nr:DUF2634 domain-containing protein [Cohnella abietis]BBI31459.1 phage-like element PBSX protein XkdS [Cohnella abietis]